MLGSKLTRADIAPGTLYNTVLVNSQRGRGEEGSYLFQFYFLEYVCYLLLTSHQLLLLAPQRVRLRLTKQTGQFYRYIPNMAVPK